VRVRDLKFIAATLGVFFIVEPIFPQTQSSNLRRLLAKQGFCCYIRAKDGVTLTELGHMACGSKSLRAVYYEWQEQHPRGDAVHASYRLIFMDGNVYLGNYEVTGTDGFPSIVGKKLIQFSSQENGENRVGCEAGELPKHAWLGGESRSLFK